MVKRKINLFTVPFFKLEFIRKFASASAKPTNHFKNSGFNESNHDKPLSVSESVIYFGLALKVENFLQLVKGNNRSFLLCTGTSGVNKRSTIENL